MNTSYPKKIYTTTSSPDIEKKLLVFSKTNKNLLGQGKINDIKKYILKPECQRALDHSHVNDLYSYQISHYEKYGEFFFPKMIVIGKLKGKYYLIDGQHRLNCINRLSKKYNIDICVNLSLLYLESENELDEKYRAINQNTPVPLPVDINDWKNFTKHVEQYILDNYSKYLKNSSNPRIPCFNKANLLEYINNNDISKKCKNNYKLFIKEMKKLNRFYLETFDESIVPYFKKNVRKYYVKSKNIQIENPFILSIYKNFEWVDKIVHKIQTGTHYENMTHVSKNYRPRIKKALRRFVWEKRFSNSFSGNCFVCFRNLDYDDMQCGHIESVFYGGKTNIDNLEPICTKCNLDMGIKNLMDYKKELDSEKQSNCYQMEY